MSSQDDDEYSDQRSEETEESQDNTRNDEEDDELGLEGEAKQQLVEPEDPRFVEQLPEKKAPVNVITLELPKSIIKAAESDDDDDATGVAGRKPGTDTCKRHVHIRLSRWKRKFEALYQPQLQQLERDNILRQLHDDEEARRKFLREEVGGGIDEEEDGKEATTYEEEGQLDDDGAEGNQQKGPPPYWLPYLLANDVFYAERVMSVMYGWAIPPPPPQKSVNANAVSFVSHGKDDEYEEEEFVDGEDPAKKRPSYFNASGAFQDVARGEVDESDNDDNESEAAGSGGGLVVGVEDIPEDGIEESSGEEMANASHTQPNVFEHCASITPLPKPTEPGIQREPLASVPAFLDPNYPFYIARDTVSGEWHLVDVHPLIRTLRLRKALLEASASRGKRGNYADGRSERESGSDDDENENQNGEDEEEEVDEDDEQDSSVVPDHNIDSGDDDDSNNAAAGDDEVPEYDPASVLVIDALMLAALHSPAVLRNALLQQAAPSLRNVQTWMEKDIDAGFPFLSAIHASLLSVHAMDAPRLPYTTPLLEIDFHLFFSDAYAESSAANHLMGCHHQKSGGVSLLFEKQVEEIPSAQSSRARGTMQALLSTSIVPTRPIQLSALSSTECLRLAVWLFVVIPKTLLLRWAQGSGDAPPVEAGNRDEVGDEGEEDPEDEEAGEGSLTESALWQRIYRDESREAARRAVEVGPSLVPAPLLLHTLLEIRRRIARERHGKAPSLHSLLVCLDRHYHPQLLEDGTTKGDPLVTASYVVNAASLSITGPCTEHHQSDAGPVPPSDEQTRHCAAQRHQRLYQSDLVLILLGLTSTAASRHAVAHVATDADGDPQAIPADDGAQSPAVAIRVRRRSSQCQGPADAHMNLFSAILKAKQDKLRSPLHRTRCGTLRFLLLALPGFRSSHVVRHLCDACPLYQLLGVNERCPLPELVYTWSLERRTESLPRYLDIFANTFWHELHCRFDGKFYEPWVMDAVRQRGASLIEKVRERSEQYQTVMNLLTGRFHRTSLRPSGIAAARNFRRFSQQQQPTGTKQQHGGSVRAPAAVVLPAQEVGAAAPLIVATGAVTLTNPSPYGAQFRKEHERVCAVFDSLQMAPRTYFTPETLYALLFSAPQIDTVAVRYVMVVKGVCTVRENPFRATEVPVLEYALVTRNMRVAMLVVGLGGSLSDLMSEGALSLEAYVEKHYDAQEVEELRQVWATNRTTIVSDPAQRYGIVRSVNFPTVA